jgi:hypothetical protein
MTGIYGTGVKFWPRERDGNGTYSFLHGRERELNFRELQRLDETDLTEDECEETMEVVDASDDDSGNNDDDNSD